MEVNILLRWKLIQKFTCTCEADWFSVGYHMIGLVCELCVRNYECCAQNKLILDLWILNADLFDMLQTAVTHTRDIRHAYFVRTSRMICCAYPARLSSRRGKTAIYIISNNLSYLSPSLILMLKLY